MSEEYLFSPSDINISNISALTRSQSIISEERICEISEIADNAAHVSTSLLADGLEIYEILSLLSESLAFDGQKPHEGALRENFSRLSFYLSSLATQDKAAFCQLYTDAMHREGREITESDFLFDKPDDETFVYVKNPYADEAYDVFSQGFSDPRVKYAKNFKDAVKQVVDGEAVYCLLPLEERGSRLASIAELIFKADLKINSVIPVFGFDGTADIKYALVSRHFTVPTYQADDDRYLEIRVSADFETSISGLMLVAENYGSTVYRVNTAMFDTEDGKKSYFTIVFHSEGGNFANLLVFLTLFTSAFTPIGIYKNLE